MATLKNIKWFYGILGHILQISFEKQRPSQFGDFQNF